MRLTRASSLKLAVGSGVNVRDMPRLATEALKGGPITGLLYAPRACRFVRLETGDGAARLEIGAPADVTLEDAYEIRLFDLDGELRWVRTGDAGEAAMLLETSAERAPPEPLEPIAAPDEIWRQEGRQILWGHIALGETAQPGWLTLTAARTGEFVVPSPAQLGEKDRLALETVSYFTRPEGRDGNLALLATRLSGFAVVPPCRPTKEQPA